jgi:hypothetical protein
MKDAFSRQLSLYLRSERTLLNLFLRDKSRQLFFVFAGLGFLLIAVLLCDIGCFFVLKQHVSVPMTAFILAGAHGLFFLICLWFARRKKQSREAQALQTIRDFAKDEVLNDVAMVKDEALDMSRTAKSILKGECFQFVRFIPILKDLLKS